MNKTKKKILSTKYIHRYRSLLTIWLLAKSTANKKKSNRVTFLAFILECLMLNTDHSKTTLCAQLLSVGAAH